MPDRVHDGKKEIANVAPDIIFVLTEGQEKPMQPSPEHEEQEIVDESNRVTGVRDRAEIHRQGLWHRSVHIFISNSRGELFLQKRSPRKDQYPEHWDSSAAGHLNPGESPEIAAHRELGEELGLDRYF